MREAKRSRTAETALDEVSDHMGEVLRRADDLLAEWSRFGEIVHVQVEREANAIGDAVASAVEGATMRGVAASVDRVLAEQIGQRIASLTAEIGRVEARARALTRTIADERTHDRRILWIVAAGVIVANVLLVVMLLRSSAPPAHVDAPAAPAGSAQSVAPATTGSADVAPSAGSADIGSAGSPDGKPTSEAAPAKADKPASDKAANDKPAAGKTGDASAPVDKAAKPGDADAAKGAHATKQLAVPPVASPTTPKHGGAAPKTYGVPVKRN